MKIFFGNDSKGKTSSGGGKLREFAARDVLKKTRPTKLCRLAGSDGNLVLQGRRDSRNGTYLTKYDRLFP